MGIRGERCDGTVERRAVDSGSTIWIISASGALLVELLLLLRERAARGDAGEDGSRLVCVPIRGRR
jgi:hypothetical protein